MNSKIRLGFQILIVVLVIWVIIAGSDVETYCPMGGILAFGTKLNQGTMPCNMSAIAVFMAMALFIGALAIGKLFCSFICPVGSVTEWFGKLGRKFKLQFTIPKVGDRILRAVKYVLLYLVVYNTITASELFCRKFDPYFGVATGFGHDTVLLWSIIAVVVTFVGALLVRQLWCKYFCFLGAASNIFVNIWSAIIIVAIYFILNLAGVKLSVMWLVGGLALAGFLFEVGFFKSIGFPFFKITVDQDKCTQCGLCTKACPHGIKVQEYQKVTHPDCMMCTECITACSKENAVSINKSMKLKYLPPILVLALISMGFILSANYEFTTLEQRWGKFDESTNIASYRQSDLKNVKCWGSAMALYKTIKDKKGIYGLDAFAKSHTVVVYYDSTETSVDKVKEMLFSPSRYKTRNFTQYTPQILTMAEFGIENLFDRIDATNLVRAFQANNHVFGFESSYGEPVVARIYYNADSTNLAEINENINTKRIEREIRGTKKVYEMDFKCADDGKVIGTMDVDIFNRRMFGEYDQKFNKYDKFNKADIHIYEIGMPNAGNFMLRRNMKYLVSHVSADTGIVRYMTSYTDRPVALIYFIPSIVDTSKIHQMLMVDTLTYFTSDTTTGTTPNLFEFEYPSKEVPVSEFIDLVEEARKY